MMNVSIASHSAARSPRSFGTEIATLFKLVEIALRHGDRPQEQTVHVALAMPSSSQADLLAPVIDYRLIWYGGVIDHGSSILVHRLVRLRGHRFRSTGRLRTDYTFSQRAAKSLIGTAKDSGSTSCLKSSAL